MDYYKIETLFQELYLLNRTHNSNDFEKALDIIIGWMKNKWVSRKISDC